MNLCSWRSYDCIRIMHCCNGWIMRYFEVLIDFNSFKHHNWNTWSIVIIMYIIIFWYRHPSENLHAHSCRAPGLRNQKMPGILVQRHAAKMLSLHCQLRYHKESRFLKGRTTKVDQQPAADFSGQDGVQDIAHTQSKVKIELVIK